MTTVSLMRLQTPDPWSHFYFARVFQLQVTEAQVNLGQKGEEILNCKKGRERVQLALGTRALELSLLDGSLCFSAYPPKSPGCRPLQPREDRTVSGKDAEGPALCLSSDPGLQLGRRRCGRPLLSHALPYRQERGSLSLEERGKSTVAIKLPPSGVLKPLPKAFLLKPMQISRTWQSARPWATGSRWPLH